MAWFRFDGGNPALKANYTLVSSEPTCGTTEEKMCALQAANDGSNKPVLDIPILSEMVLALQDEANTANVRLKAR